MAKLFCSKVIHNPFSETMITESNMEKPTIICGVYHQMTEEEKNNFINMMSENGKYNVIFDDKNSLPKLAEMSLPFLKK